MAREMAVGDSATASVGTSGSVVGRQNSNLMNTVKDVIFAGVMLNQLQGNSAPAMRPGNSMMNVLGGNVEAYSTKPNSEFTKVVMGLALLGFAAKLLDNSSTPAPTQEQMRSDAVAKEEMRIAGIMKDDAVKQEAFAEDEKRKAFFTKPPQM